MATKKARSAAKKLRLGSLRAHVLVCTGGNCAPKSEQRRAVKGLRKQLQARGLTKRESGVTCSTVDCLKLCSGGPIAVVWPDGAWYGNATSENLERILDEHIIGGRVIKELRIAGPKKLPRA